MIKDYRGYPYENSRVENPINLAFGGQVDAGNRLRVSQLTSLGDFKLTHEINSLYWSVATSGTIIKHSSSKPGAEMLVTGHNQWAVLRTRMYHAYFNGKAQVGEITFASMTAQANCIKRVGYFDTSTNSPYTGSKDGFAFSMKDGQYYFECWKNGKEVFSIPRSDWDDPVDGTGPSGYNIDLSAFNIFYFNFLYLGGSTLSLGFIYDNRIVVCYRYNHSGIVDNTFILKPNKPITYEIRSEAGLSNNAGFTAVCCTVASEGMTSEIGVHRGVDSLGGGSAAEGSVSPDFIRAQSSSDEYALLGVRLKSNRKDIQTEILDKTILLTTNDDGRWRMLLNPTYGGTVTWYSVANSAIELGITGFGNPSTETITDPGFVIKTGFLVQDDTIEKDVSSALRLGIGIDGTRDEIFLAFQPLTTNCRVYGALNFREFL